MKNFITLHWNRKPGVFVNKNTGDQIYVALSGEVGPIFPNFTGSVHEWYETLVETLIDCRNQLHREAKMNSDKIIVRADPDTWCMLQTSVLFKPVSGIEGTMCGMEIQRTTKVRRFEPTVEFRYTSGGRHHSLKGTVRILED
jgi:hypothetical protein